MDIKKYDKNFVSTVSDDIKKRIEMYDSEQEPFQIYGLPFGYSGRFPRNLSINDSLRALSECTAGGRIRFKTDSDFVVLSLALPSICNMPHMTLAGSVGSDLYIKEEKSYVYGGTFMPPGGNNAPEEIEKRGGYEAVVKFSDKRMRDITINLPLYNPVTKVYIGLDSNAKVEKSDSYTYEIPIVYYGSSITQGGCASRPGNSYQAMLTRWYDADHINMGFSGNAKGEENVAEYLAGMKMSVFVLDYDHNAPTVEHLRETHSRMFKIIREKNPDIPIIMATRPKENLSDEEKQRWKIIKKTYTDALKSGDNNVYFVDGTKMFKNRGGDSCTVDGCHPNDLGFYAMSMAFDEAFKEIGLKRFMK